MGGTSIKLGIVTASGDQVAEASLPTRESLGPEDAIQRICGLLANTLPEQQHRVVAVGLGTPGPLDSRRGLILDPVNMPGWRHFPIRQALAQALERPVTYANDANAAAFGEFWLGKGRDYDNVVLLTLGTGVGSGIIVEGQMLVGPHDQAAECGHMVVDYLPEARVCSCGRRGHLEAYSSASAVAERARQLARVTPQSQLAELLTASGDLSARDVYHCAERADAAAELIIEQTAEYLSRGIVNIAQTVDPDIVLLGGAMDFGGAGSPVGRRFLQQVDERVRPAVFRRIADHLKIEFAQLGGAAGWIGAAGLAKRNYDQLI